MATVKPTRLSWSLALAGVLLVACGDDDVPVDAGADVGADVGASACVSDDDCSDGRFCNGAERCLPGAGSSDARGCSPGSPPCPGSVCDERAGRCVPDCDDDGGCPDACMGDACPDACMGDACDCPDADGDGFRDDRCGGDDCDDADASVHPGAVERCNGVDDNCNGVVDEGCDCVVGTSEPCDTELDGIGNCRAGTRLCTAAGWSSCRGSVLPGPELCNTLLEDENCNGVVDEGCDCLAPLTRTCSTDIGRCVARTQTCSLSGQWPRDCDDEPGVVFPREEECNGVDDDCDGIVDNGCACSHGAGRACGTDVGVCTVGLQSCEMGTWTECSGIGPTAETCNRVDDDCDGRVDEGVATAACAFTATGSTGRSAFMACEPNCGPSAPAAAIRRLGSTADTTARALWLNSRDELVDWGSSTFSVTGDFRLHLVSGTATAGVASVVVSPQSGLGGAPRRHLPDVTPGRVGFAAEVTLNPFGYSVRLVRLTSASATVVGESAMIAQAACVPSRGGDLQYRVTLRAADGGSMRATVRIFGRPGCDFTEHVDFAETNWLETLYGSDSDDRRYEVGVIVHGSDTNGDHDLESLAVTRLRTSGERGFCQPCPWRL